MEFLFQSHSPIAYGSVWDTIWTNSMFKGLYSLEKRMSTEVERMGTIEKTVVTSVIAGLFAMLGWIALTITNIQVTVVGVEKDIEAIRSNTDTRYNLLQEQIDDIEAQYRRDHSIPTESVRTH